MAPLVRTGGSHHTGLAALPHRNIHPNRLPIPAAMISNVVFIVFSPSFFYQIDFIIVFILHISADHRSLPTAHHEEVCEGLSSHRVRIHTVLFFLIQTLIRQHSTFGAYLVHFAFTV